MHRISLCTPFLLSQYCNHSFVIHQSITHHSGALNNCSLCALCFNCNVFHYCKPNVTSCSKHFINQKLLLQNQQTSRVRHDCLSSSLDPLAVTFTVNVHMLVDIRFACFCEDFCQASSATETENLSLTCEACWVCLNVCLTVFVLTTCWHSWLDWLLAASRAC